MVQLSNLTKIRIRFSEVDSMRIVWHGNYVKFLEDGREAFGEQYGLGYYDVYEFGFLTPIVKVDLDYKHQIKYGDELEIKTIYENVDAAKICFKYELKSLRDGVIAAKGRSVQVFLDKNGELQLTNPDFYVEWKKENNLL